MAAGSADEGDLWRGTTATEGGGGRESRLCLPFGGKLRGVGRTGADLRTARSQGASVFRTAFLDFSQADLCAAAGTSSAARRLGRCRRHGRWGRRRPVGGSGRRGVGSVQKTGSLAAAAGWASSSVNHNSPCPALRENECLDRFVGALRRVVRPVAARLQARQNECGVALQMFVAGLATDAELFAQLGHGKAPATREDHASIDLFAGGYVGPEHRPRWNLSPRLITG